MTERFTVLGADGFIGKHLVTALRTAGHAVLPIGRSDSIDDEDLGHVIHAAGLTVDADSRPDDTIRAHVDLTKDLLDAGRFSSLLYLSSTRVYEHADSGAEDDASVRATDGTPLFTRSKLEGEAHCSASLRPNVRIARLSNVYGDDAGSGTFLASIIGDALLTGTVHLRTTLDSAKDYLSIDDAVRVLPQISLRGTEALYNVASGHNTTNAALMTRLADLTGCTWDVAADAIPRVFPLVDVSRMVREFGPVDHEVLDDLPEVIEAHRLAIDPV